MTSASIRRSYLLPALFLIFQSFCFAQEEFMPYPAIIHIHSHISGGMYSPRKLVSLARDKGIKILIFSDTFLKRWEYGLPVFPNIFKVSKEEDSVARYGIKRYLQDLNKVKEEFPDMLILEGVEIAPFYWWSGSILRNNLTLNDRNRHLLVTGLKRHQDYTHLPLVCNRYIWPQLKDMPPLLIPVSLIVLGIFFLNRTKSKKFLGIILNVLGILFLFNLFPFSASRYNPYHGQKQYLPYQDLITYVNKKGGLVFWAHPEVTETTFLKRFATIGYSTLSYPESLIETSGYTGFGVNMLPGTSHNLILAGGEWDNVLTGYCEGKRGQPVWVIAERDYRGGGPIDSVQNIFFLPRFTYESVYEALRKGRLYIRYHLENKINISLSDFHIGDSQDAAGKFGFIADQIQIKGKPRLSIKGSYKIIPPEDLKIEIIRNSEIIKEFEFSNEGVFDLEFQDDSLQASHKKSYYRLIFFAGGKIILVTNPIFIEMQNG